MSEHVTRDRLMELVGWRHGPFVSLFVPGAPEGFHGESDRARLRHLLRAAEIDLVACGTTAEATATLLAPVAALLEDAGFGRRERCDLAIFAAPGLFRVLRAPVSLGERVEVGSRFVVAPLAAALSRAERFYVLALSLNAVRVLEVTPHGVECLAPPGLPASMEEALGYVEFYTGVQVHSSAPGLPGPRRGVVHGHGDGDEERSEEGVLHFFRLVAEALRGLPDTTAPWVLAAVGEHVPLYRRASRNAHLLPATLEGNPELLSDRELGARAEQIVEEAMRERVVAAIARYRELGDRERAVAAPEAVLAAACQGRVDTLLFDPSKSLWGVYDGDSGRLTRRPARLAGDDDLLDLAVFQTLRHRGEVLAVDPGAAPGGAAVAAILRY